MLLNVEDFRRKARKALPRLVFDYVNGAAEDVLAAARALAALQQRHQQAGARVQAGHHIDHRQGHLQRHAAAEGRGPRDLLQEFHGLLYQSCRNEFLVDQIDLIRSRTAAYRLKRFDMPGGLRRSWEGHSQLIDAVVAGNRRAAHDAAVEHIEMGGREFAEMVRQLPEDVFANSSRPPAAKPPPDPMWPDVRTARAAPQAGDVPARQPKH